MSRDEAFDFDEALRRIDHDHETFRMMAEVFLEQAPKDLAAIRRALRERDVETATRSAHRLKGSVLQFCADAAAEAAKAVETSGKTGNLEGASGLYPKLEAEMLCLFDALRAALEKDLAA